MRFKMLFSLAVVVSCGTLPALCSAAQPNILLLFADDWRHDTLSCAGNPVVQTPAIDRLAQEGVRFTQACVTTSICGVSRASLYTGQWMSRHGCRAFSEFQTPSAETYPALLKAGVEPVQFRRAEVLHDGCAASVESSID